MTLPLAAALALALHATPSPAPFAGTAELRIVARSPGGVVGTPREEVATTLRLFFSETAWRIEKESASPDTSSAFVRHPCSEATTHSTSGRSAGRGPHEALIVNDRTENARLVLDSPSSAM
jgi:hypothetical protein